MPLPFMSIDLRFFGTLFPDSTIDSTEWEGNDNGTTNLHTYVNAPTDATFLRLIDPAGNVASCGVDVDTEDINFVLEDASPPVSGEEVVTYNVRARKVQTTGTGTATMTMEFREGATVRASRTGIVLTPGIVTYSDQLSNAERDAVGDWENVRIFVTIDACVDNLGDEMDLEIYRVFADFEAS